jgi:DNA repair protein RadC
VAEIASSGVCGESDAERILAALELGRRSLRALAEQRAQIIGPEDAVALLHPRLAALERERTVVLVLDRKHRLLREIVTGIGGVAHAPMAPLDVLGAALRVPCAAAVLVAHNHPSGDPEPSAEDRAVTRRLAEACALIGLEFVDHVIVAARGWSSLRRDA